MTDNHFITDTHCHLDYLAREGLDLSEVIARAKERNIGRMISIATKREGWQEIIKIAHRYSPEIAGGVDCTVGIHPHEAGNHENLTLDELIRASQDQKVVGLGETGLDYHYDFSPVDIQKKLFHIHCQAAQQTGLPLVIHAREADDDIADILEENHRNAPLGIIMHCFSSGRALAERALAINGYISFSGIITFKNAETVREVAKIVPLDRLLVETDSPYLAPVPYRGKKCEPAYVADTLACLAELREVSVEALTKITTENAERILPSKPNGHET